MIGLPIELGLYHEFLVFIQTPFDLLPFHIGTYLLDEKFKDLNLLRVHDYRRLEVNQNPVIFSSHWSEQISSNFVLISLLTDSLNKKQTEIEYLITNLSK